jgi:ribose transport system ATP-binding protein
MKENRNESLILQTRNIVKEFSGVRVLNDVTVGIRRGEIMGLIGENGAGKSTLIKIICGIYHPTLGSLAMNGSDVEINDYITAKRLGIALVPQEFNLINTLTVYENMFLGNEMVVKGGLLDKRQMRERAMVQLEELGMPIDVNLRISELSVAEKQHVEISKALLLDAGILIMDEPTTTLTGHEIKTLFALMRQLKEQGVTIIFVSHKLQEIVTICDRVTVLRDGNLITIDEVSQINEHDIARKMIGRDFQQVFPAKKIRSGDDVVLKVEHLSSGKMVKDVSFELRKGEILGFAGLVGSGRTETAETVMGLRPVSHGSITLAGKPVTIKTPRDAVSLGLGYLSEDRQGKGIVQDFDIPQNITLISLGEYLKRFLIDKRKELEKSSRYVDKFNIVAASMRMGLRYFSGGNQQKVYLARWVDTDPQILILDEPTRGIDVNAKREIYDFIHSLAESGISCIVISSEMEEVMGLCSRVYVMREGAVTGCLEGDRISEEQIMFHATGIHDTELLGRDS